ncbi:hypothetical protein [Persicitalea jodogahamensis]|uniref:Uncharacterized protein n=1 Tax=Persicitalea jodogahamensis TaxID=402147 RepID=A0A8J3DDM2_9BACT|nr:hypothetical protein [Persicitalea jodogahamensis]GHB86485.1 hypothetical protein GCM10007390_47550 [Persicitalea jodogahamensis]
MQIVNTDKAKRRHLHWLLTAAVFCLVSTARADSLNCNLTAYKPQPGLIAMVAGQTLTLTWNGERKSELRLRFVIERGVPTIRELALRPSGGQWRVLATHVIPEYRIVSGVRRVTRQQTEPLEALGVPLTAEKLNEIKWDAFWDAPLFMPDVPPLSHKTSIPAREAFANHPGMPRKPEEINRATAQFRATGCSVKTNGGRLEIVFPGVEAGIFTGYLQYDIFKGSNLIRQMVSAKTSATSAAFKYDAGIKGLPIRPASRLLWRDLSNHNQEYRLGGPVGDSPATVWSSNRLIAAEVPGGSIAVFPPPHSFYWARETGKNLGYSWYRKDSDSTFSIGMQQAEKEDEAEFYQNFALYSARPGTWQRMPVFLHVSSGNGSDALEAALAFTHRDFFKPLPGYKVMGSHYHVGLVERLDELGGHDNRLNDVETMKGIGVNIYGVIDGVRGPARREVGESFLKAQAEYYDAARRQSDRDFLVMPNDENSTSGRTYELGGHHDLLISRPTFWQNERKPGQPLVEQHPRYGRVYNLGSPADLMAMTEHENALISIPHPGSKGSTGYPDAIRDAPQFLHQNFFSLGYRWGMGIDASETRLGEYRFLNLWDEVNNWMAARNLPPKFALAISEGRSDYGDRGKPPYDDTYGLSPVNYLKLDSVPTVDDMSSIINVLRRGDYFVSTGEVLIPSYSVQGTGAKRTITAEVEWTFPLDFVELVWGDGEKTDRQIITTTDLPPFGRKKFILPFDATDKKWVRFAAWDIATSGALVQPVSLLSSDNSKPTK